MAVFIRHDAITSVVRSASLRFLCVNEGSQPHESLDRDSRPAFHHHSMAVGLIEHPAGNQDPQILPTLGDDRRIAVGPESANHPDLLPEKRMKPVSDPRRAELMSSVLMRCATALPPIYWMPGCRSGLLANISATARSSPPSSISTSPR